MRSILSICLIASISLVSAQELNFVFEDTANNDPLIKISSFNYYSSNRFNNELMDKFIFGGNITTEIKDNNSERLKVVNTMGAESEHKIESYSPEIYPFKKDKYGMIMSFSDNHLVSSNISKDLFNTVFYGNAPYIGDTMDFSYSHIQYQHYQKFGVGFYDKKSMSSIQISYVSGSKSINARLSDSWMHSQNSMDTIELSLAGNGIRTENFSPYLAFQGSGFAVDLNYNFSFYNKKENRQIINLKINNIGAIFWNKNTYNYSIDSSNTYTGFDIQDFIGQDTSSSNTYNFVDTLGLIESQGAFVEVLPLELIVQKLGDRYSGQKLQAIFGFKAVLTSDYFPYLYAGVYYQPIESFSLSSRLSYGGFGGVKWGLNFNYWIKDKAYISLGTFDMIGNVSKKFGFGRSLNLSAYFKL